MHKLAYIFLLALISTGFFCWGYLYAEPTTETVEVIREIPVKIREFSGEAHLAHWLRNRDKTIRFVGVADFNNYDCDDYAQALVRQARQDGYDIGVELDDNHMLCNTIIGNDLYYIEPRDNSYWLVTVLD